MWFGLVGKVDHNLLFSNSRELEKITGARGGGVRRAYPAVPAVALAKVGSEVEMVLRTP